MLTVSPSFPKPEVDMAVLPPVSVTLTAKLKPQPDPPQVVPGRLTVLPLRSLIQPGSRLQETLVPLVGGLPNAGKWTAVPSASVTVTAGGLGDGPEMAGVVPLMWPSPFAR